MINYFINEHRDVRRTKCGAHTRQGKVTTKRCKRLRAPKMTDLALVEKKENIKNPPHAISNLRHQPNSPITRSQPIRKRTKATLTKFITSTPRNFWIHAAICSSTACAHHVPAFDELRSSSHIRFPVPSLEQFVFSSKPYAYVFFVAELE